MPNNWLLAAAITAAFSATGAHAAPPPAPAKTLTAFADDTELAALLKKWGDEAKRRRETEERARALRAGSALAQSVAPAAAPASKAEVAKSAADSDSVTNVQHAGVDEGGIVKMHGDHLIVLRRGRLFTVKIGDGALKPTSFADAYGPGIDPSGAWYDEMLVSGNRIVVIGYSYARGGSEIGLFDIDAAGQLTYRATYHLRSNDYYSSRNYASRLIGDTLVMYSPMYLNLYGGDPFAAFPAVRKWRGGANPGEFKRIAPATRVYRTDEDLDPDQGVALHSVTVCKLGGAELDCSSTAVLGSPGRVFYVAPNAVYVWTTKWNWNRGRSKPAAPIAATPDSSVFRIPLDGSAPTALKAAGAPVDQFSFLEGDDGHLNVLVRANGGGDGMWSAETRAGDMALLRVRVNAFGDGKDSAPASAYQPLPSPEGGYALQNRFVGPYLLYGSGTSWYRPQATKPDAEIYAVRYAQRGAVYAVPLGHGVDRIEALGANAVAVGSDGKDLRFTSLQLGRYPAAAGTYVRPNAAQGETRSHGFFYKPETEQDGVLGLPIIGGDDSAAGQLRKTSASVLYLRNQGLRFAELGTLAAKPGSDDDGCRASCVDWYGNARPLFVRGRVFALLGYEIVEGKMEKERITETRRVNFAPRRGGFVMPL